MASQYVGKEFSGIKSQDGTIVSYKRTIPELGPHDILLRITHSGVCHSDSVFVSLGAPVALGHEGVGIVETVGSLVTQFKVGERAGAGFHRWSCGQCNYCLKGEDIHCYNRVTMGEGDFDNGTFGQYYIGRETWLHKIPDGLASEHAAPLQCAGATVYTALSHTVSKEKRVGIFGIGGLGHLAIQYAAKMGAEVVVFSTTAAKEQEARNWGAHEFYLVSEMFDKLTAPIDVLVVAGHHYPDWDRVMVKEFLARNGTVVPLTAPIHGAISFPSGPVFFNSYHMYSSIVGSRAIHQEMLEFSAKHHIEPKVQVVPHEGVETVQKIFQDLKENKIRYRAVLAMG